MREEKTLLRLRTLQQAGFRYLCTQDDGDTWVGTHEDGLPIDRLIDWQGFLGEVVVDPPCTSVPEPM